MMDRFIDLLRGVTRVDRERMEEESEYLYLAHPLDSRKWVRAWELEFERKYGIQLLNPFYDETRDDIDKIDNGREKYKNIQKPSIIVERDLDAIRNGKGIISVIDGSISYGTIMEIVYAKMFDKRVYGLITNGHQEHPWLRYHMNHIFTDLGKLEEKVSKDFRRKYKW